MQFEASDRGNKAAISSGCVTTKTLLIGHFLDFSPGCGSSDSIVLATQLLLCSHHATAALQCIRAASDIKPASGNF